MFPRTRQVAGCRPNRLVPRCRGAGSPERRSIVIRAVLAALGAPSGSAPSASPRRSSTTGGCASGTATFRYACAGLRKKRWTRGHAIWVSDVFAWRGSPAAWNEELLSVSDATPRAAAPEEPKKLRRLGHEPAIATSRRCGRRNFEVAAASEQASALLGPFTRTTASSRRVILPSARAISGKPGAVSR